MLTTTFLLATAVLTAVVLGAMLLLRKRDAERARFSVGAAAVGGLAAALTALGFAML